jgi:hypothetical protein
MGDELLVRKKEGEYLVKRGETVLGCYIRAVPASTLGRRGGKRGERRGLVACMVKL